MNLGWVCPEFEPPWERQDSELCYTCHQTKAAHEALAAEREAHRIKEPADDGHRASCPWPGYACTCGKLEVRKANG